MPSGVVHRIRLAPLGLSLPHWEHAVEHAVAFDKAMAQSAHDVQHDKEVEEILPTRWTAMATCESQLFSARMGGIETIPNTLTAWPAATASTYPASGIAMSSKYKSGVGAAGEHAFQTRDRRRQRRGRVAPAPNRAEEHDGKDRQDRKSVV